MNRLRKIVTHSKYYLEKIKKYQIINNEAYRNFCTNDRPVIILGIETSCDDTGIALVDSTGKILSEALHSQLTHHLIQGGINPPVARDLHKENIQHVYNECMNSTNIKLSDVDAIATTVEPGLPLSLCIGRDFGLHLSRIANKPLIPIHHMQAHALTARITEKVDFPFLVLLISGGHCLLSFVTAVNDFKILGSTIDDAPGEAFDKVARDMKLIQIPEYSKICGGEAIELAAKKADDPDKFPFPVILSHYRDCNFSFSGLKTKAKRYIQAQEKEYNIGDDDLIPEINNLSAAFLLAVTRHISLRTQRAMEFLDKKQLIPEDKKTLVVSGGVASNNSIANGLRKICLENGYRLVKPPPRLCTDNGIMIAWNGVERFKANIGVLRDRNVIDKVDISHRTPIGDDWRADVLAEGIRRKWVKINFDDLIQR